MSFQAITSSFAVGIVGDQLAELALPSVEFLAKDRQNDRRIGCRADRAVADRVFELARRAGVVPNVGRRAVHRSIQWRRRWGTRWSRQSSPKSSAPTYLAAVQTSRWHEHSTTYQKRIIQSISFFMGWRPRSTQSDAASQDPRRPKLPLRFVAGTGMFDLAFRRPNGAHGRPRTRGREDSRSDWGVRGSRDRQ